MRGIRAAVIAAAVMSGLASLTAAAPAQAAGPATPSAEAVAARAAAYPPPGIGWQYVTTTSGPRCRAYGTSGVVTMRWRAYACQPVLFPVYTGAYELWVS